MADIQENKFLRTIKAILIGSDKINTWSLSVFGGSLLAIFSTSYLQPESKYFKLVYLLLIVGWIFLVLSIKFGINISGRSMAAELVHDKEEKLKEIFFKSNTDFEKQLSYFKKALFVFALWLTTYLIWWIFIYANKPNLK
jgi:hypothetical protein